MRRVICRRGAVRETVRMYSGGQWVDAALVVREDLRPGDIIPGPAIIAEKNATTVVEPGWAAELTAFDHLALERGRSALSNLQRERRWTRCCWRCSTTCS